RGDQVADRADAADARHQSRHFVERTPLDKLLEAANLRHVEMRIVHIARVVERNGDLGVPLNASDRIDRDGLRHGSSYAPKRVLPATLGWRSARRSDRASKMVFAEGGQPGMKTSTRTTVCTARTTGSSGGSSVVGS